MGLLQGVTDPGIDGEASVVTMAEPRMFGDSLQRQLPDFEAIGIASLSDHLQKHHGNGCSADEQQTQQYDRPSVPADKTEP